MKPKLRTVSPDDSRLRTAFIFYKFAGGVLLLLWLVAIVTVVTYGSLPNFAKVLLWIVIWVIMPDLKGVKLLFSDFESYRRHEIHESMSHSTHTAIEFGMYSAMMSIMSKFCSVSPNDPYLRTEFIFLKLAGWTLLLLWIGAVVTVAMYWWLPNFTKVLLGGVIWIICPDKKGLKLLFSNLETYRHHKINESMSD